MIPTLGDVLSDYRAGLDAGLDLLARLEELAVRPRAVDAASPPSADETDAAMAERARLLDGLQRLESRLAPLRARISADLAAARATPGFLVVAERQRTAADAVARIIEADRASLTALEHVDARRRADAHAIETAGTTLAAYRRVLEGAQGPSGLVDERG